MGLTQSADTIVDGITNKVYTAAEKTKLAGLQASAAIYAPSDATGATDMTAELEAFRLANPGKLVRVADGSTILLKNAFSTATTGDILLDFSNCTILYNNNTSSDYAIQCNNVANAATEVSVSSLAMATVNTDATVTQVTLGSTLAASRFDWIALYSTDANPAISGGQFGEIFQLLSDESSLVLTATRKLNNYGFYTTNIKARKLDASRRVYIKGGTIKANGNTEDHSIVARAGGILVQGFVDPLVENVTFDHPWSYGLRFQCCAAPRARDITVRNVGNLATYNGFTYGVYFYGMNDAGDARNLVVRNGRHAAFTTDGNSGGTSTWYAKGIPTNLVITGVHGYNCHASVVDTHEEGDGIIIDGVQDFYPYQDADISPNFSGLGCQIRAANVTLRNFVVYGGTRGIKINAIDHGFEDQVTLENINIGNTTQTASVDADTAVTIDDQSSLTNKRHVYFDGVMNNVGMCFSVGKTAKLTLKSVSLRRFDTIMDAGAGSIVTFSGHAEFDYRNDLRTAPYFGILCRSDAPNGGASVVFLQKPKIIKGTDNSPTYLLTESDTTANKKIYVAGIIQYNPSGVTNTLAYSPSATTFTTATVAETYLTQMNADALNTTTNPVVVSGAVAPSTGQVLTATSATTANWQTVSGGGGGFTVTSVQTSAYTAAASQLVPADATSAAFTVTLPTAPADKSEIVVKKIDSSANAITVACGGSDVLEKAGGSTSTTLSLQNQAISLHYASSTGIWYVVSDDLPLAQIDSRYPLNSTVTTKGDLLAATGNAAIARVGVGADNLVLLADSSQSTGVRWGVAGNPRPTDQNFAGWAFDPAFAGSNATPTAGKVYMTRVVAATSTNITKLYEYITAASAVSATANQNFLGLYDASLNLLAGSAAGNIDSQLTSAGLITGTIASTAVVAGTAYYVGFVWNGTATTFTLAREVGNALVNVNLATTVARFASSNTGRTTLPNPSAALVFDSTAAWAAMSA